MNVTDPYDAYEASRASEPFRVAISRGAKCTLIVAHGELDVAGAPELEAALQSQTGRVIVDLREVSFIDGRGLWLLLDADARSRNDGNNLAFVPGDAVRRLFEVAGMPDPLKYVPPPAG